MLSRSSAILATVAALLLLASPGAAQTITIGQTAILTVPDSGNRNLLLAQRATLTQAATLQSLSFYVTRAAGQLRLGVYDASGPSEGPGTKLAETSAFSPRTGWNTRSVTTPVLLEPGVYWLAYFPSSNNLAFRRELTGSARYYSRSFGTLPTTFSTSPTPETVHWSLYAVLTPAAAPSAPTLSLAANPTTVAPDGLSTLTWSSTNATSCTASNVGAEGSSWWGAKPTNGQDVRGPLTATATYSLACTGPGGTVSRAVTISVGTPPTPAPTVTLTAAPTSITVGQSATLTWSSTNAASCSASGAWTGSREVSGQMAISPTATATYSLACTGAGGTASRSVTVTVVVPPAPTVSLTADPTTVTPGQAFTLTWSSTDATTCTASGGWSGAQPLSGSLVVLTTTTHTYTLTCTGGGGSSAKSVTVTVNADPVQLTLTWTDNAGGTASFKVERKTGSGGTYAPIATTGVGAVSWIDTTPVAGTTYCYRVLASTDAGDSGYSNEACGSR